MDNLIKRWTTLPIVVRPASRRRNRYSIYNTGLHRMPIRERQQLIIPRLPDTANDRRELLNEHEDSAQSIEDVGRAIDLATSALKKMHFAAAVIDKDAIEQIDWTKMGNGVAYIFPRSNLRARIHPVPVISMSGDMCVHIFPLSMVAAIARLQFSGGSTMGGDFRAFYNYGASVPWNSNELGWKRAGHVARKYTAVKQPYPRRSYVVFNGELVTHENTCMTNCPRKMMWSLGYCDFATFNCSLGTDLYPDMLKSPAPDFDRLLGVSNYLPAKDTIARDAFEPYWIDDMVYTLEGVEELREERSIRAQNAVYTKRLKTHVCTACSFGTEKYRSGRYLPCETKPESCDGPIFEGDVASCVQKLEPWEYHVLAMNRDKVPIEAFRKKLSGLSGRRNDLMVVRPVDAANMPRTLDHAEMTRSATKSDKRVHLVVDRQRWDGYSCLVSYREMCDAMKIRPVRTERQLHKAVQWTEFITDEVHIAARNLLRDRYNWPELFMCRFTFSATSISYWESGSFRKSGRYVDLSSGAPMRRLIEKGLSEERYSENRQLKRVIKDTSIRISLPVIELVKRIRTGGEAAAKRAMMTKRQRWAFDTMPLPFDQVAGSG